MDFGNLHSSIMRDEMSDTIIIRILELLCKAFFEISKKVWKCFSMHKMNRSKARKDKNMRVVDMHCDTISELLKKKRKGLPEELRRNTCHVDLERMLKSDYLLQNFALFVNLSVCEEPWQEVCELFRLYQEEIEKNEDILAPVFCYKDILRNKESGRISALLTVEEGDVCQGDISRLDSLYAWGVRMMTLTWNHPNALGYPVSVSQGLTELGKCFVERMEELGMIVDVSHLSDAGFYDVLHMTKKPFVASHSNARSICAHGRNLTDDMIRGLAEKGGCMGLNFYADFLKEVSEGTENPGEILAVVNHARHIVNVGGIEVLGLGSDFDGIDTNKELPGVQSMDRLWNALHKAGFSQAQLDKIFGENVLRVYQEVF